MYVCPNGHSTPQGYNLSRGKWGFNANKRNGGHFLWTQIYAARRAGVRIIYGAMWDEYDEGTAFMPVVSSSKELPVHPEFEFLALDADGYSLPSDWYMRIAGFTAEALRGERMLHETFPIKELQDYWATRPKYEEDRIQDEQEEQSRRSQMAYQNWVTHQGGATTDEIPPPPYSLEEEQGTQIHQEFIRPPQTSSASNSRPIPPVATKPTLGSSSGASVSSISLPSLPARTSSSRNSSPLPLTASPTVAHLANDLARQKLSQPCFEVFSGPQQPCAPESSAIYPSVIQMPSVEISLERPCTIPNAPQGPYIATDNPARPHTAPYPPVQDYHQHRIAPAQPHSGGSHTPRPTSAPTPSCVLFIHSCAFVLNHFRAHKVLLYTTSLRDTTARTTTRAGSRSRCGSGFGTWARAWAGLDTLYGILGRVC